MNILALELATDPRSALRIVRNYGATREAPPLSIPRSLTLWLSDVRTELDGKGRPAYRMTISSTMENETAWSDILSLDLATVSATPMSNGHTRLTFAYEDALRFWVEDVTAYLGELFPDATMLT